MSFVRFGLFVTGEGEEDFCPQLFRVFHEIAPGGCVFEVIGRIGQQSPRGPARMLEMAGRGKLIPDKDAYNFAIPARNWLRDKGPTAYVLLIDDLEWDRQGIQVQVFGRYAKAFDLIIPPALRARVGVFFFVMMLEAYYFACPALLRSELGIEVEPPADVESMRHPKNELKRLRKGFDEKLHGAQIVPKLDLELVLRDPETCRSLRTIFAWLHRALGLSTSERFALARGRLCDVTRGQIDALPPVQP